MTEPDRAPSAVPVIAGITGETAALLNRLHRGFTGPFSVADAAEVLGISTMDARRLLARLTRKRWLTRIRRGLYLAVPLDAATPGEWVADPWLLAAKAFEPCYIGGWSAAEHWSLTEQLFRDVLVVTTRSLRRRDHVLQGVAFTVTRRGPQAFEFGLRPVWRGTTRVQVSDPSRTLVDMLDDPSIGGGIRHVADIVAEYLRSDDRDDEQLVSYGDRLGNRSVFKRLGWLLELLGQDGALIEACVDRRSAGLAKLDPSVSSAGTIVRRWSLRVNVAIDPQDAAS